MVPKILLAIASVVVLMAIPSGSAYAACGTKKETCTYSVKFVCGLQAPIPGLVPPSEPPVKPGNYATAVNIQNFGDRSQSITATASIALNISFTLAPTSSILLETGQATEIGCSEIVGMFPPPFNLTLPAFITGFVEIVSPVQLSVTGVYTAQACDVPATGGACQPTGPVSIAVVREQPFTTPGT